MGEIESVHGGGWDADMLDAIAEVIRKAQGDHAMVQSFALVVETIDLDDRYISTFCAPGQKAWESMGLLQYALTAEQNFGITVEGDE